MFILMTRILLLLFIISLSACTSAPSRDDSLVNAQREQIWQQRQVSLNNIEGWHIKGRMAVVNGSEYWSINLDWQQSDDTYVIFLNGPFGAGKIKLAGSRHGVILTDGDNNMFFAKDPDTLLYEQTGVHMPVNSLRYWVLGLPEPEMVHQHFFDEQGRLGELDRAPWQIKFKRYTNVNNLQVPDKIFITQGEDVSVRMIIADWQLNTRQIAKNP